MFLEGERKTATLKKEVEGVLRQKEGINIEYIDICDAHTLEELDTIKNRAVLAIACRIGKTRLIDNTILTEA